MKNKLVTLLIMDGFGINPETKGNAISAANKINLDYYYNRTFWGDIKIIFNTIFR